MKTNMIIACIVAGGMSALVALSIPVVRKVCRLLDHVDEVVTGVGPRVQELVDRVEQLVERMDSLIIQTQPKIESTIDAVEHTVEETAHLVHSTDEVVQEMNVVSDIEAGASEAYGAVQRVARGVSGLFSKHPAPSSPNPTVRTVLTISKSTQE